MAPPPPPKQLTIEEIEAENSQYRQTLNVLKVHLQPIMEQIKRKYKVFRSPVIPHSQYQYLFNEADPNYVRPDVADAPPRPYVPSKDANGTPGLLETATKKFYYNLDIVMIEERLAHGYYIDPHAYLRDVASLESDAKTLGDRALWLKANELLTNVKVDVGNVIDNFRQANVNWDAEWEREQYRQRELKRINKARKKGGVQSAVGQVQLGTANSRHPGNLQNPHTTTAHFQVIGDVASTNGGTSQPNPTQNGTSVPSRAADGDVPMTDADSLAVGAPNTPMQPPSQWPRMEARSLHTSVQATPGGTNNISQISAVQSLPPGVSPSALINEASTTKTSDPSHRSSNFSTQMTNGAHHEPNSLVENMPDTYPLNHDASQGTSSDDQWIHSQAHGLKRGYISQSSQFQGSLAHASTLSSSGNKSSHAPSMANLLNDPSPDEPSQSQRQYGSSQQVEVDEQQAQFFLEQVTMRTSGCTIEQLQQIYREMMVELWKTRGEHNRTKVLISVSSVFNEAIGDIELTQGLQQSSQPI